MVQLVPYLVGGLVVFLTIDYLPSVPRLAGLALPAPAADAVAVSNSARKSDRGVMLAAPAAPTEITIVEVVGLRDATIVYRDRDGRELFRTDPVSNVTVVTKGVVLPKVTVRQHSGAAVKPLPVEVPREQARDRKTPTPNSPGRRVPVGCEPSFSPVAQPSMAHHTGRCVAEIGGATRLAALAR